MDPPHFRAGDWLKSFERCTHFRAIAKDGQWGTCSRYDRIMGCKELCDSWTLRSEEPKSKVRSDYPGAHMTN